MIASRVWLLSATAVALALPASSVHAQAPAAVSDSRPIVRLATTSVGTIYGAVVDDGGAPVEGAVVSALGGATAFAVTDKAGQYRLTDLPAGPYVVRAHRDGFAGARSTLVNVRPAAKAPSSFTLRRVDDAPPVLAAGVGVPGDVAASPRDESPLAWRLRRLTRSVLKDDGRTIPAELGDTTEWFDDSGPGFLARAFDASARFATDVFFAGPVYGQVNLLTATAYDDAGEMVDFGRPSGVAFFAVGAPVGTHADWSARAAMNSGDVTSWTMAGDYVSRATARHQVTLGMTYSLQAYRGGNFAALQAVPDGHRKVASVSGSHEFDLSRFWRLGYGARYEHYDYLRGNGQLSPMARLTFSPTRNLHVHAKASLQQVAPGAEEFVPPADAAWVPPQRTFAPLGANRFDTERLRQFEVGVTREFAAMTVSVRTFRQAVQNQLVTVFGAADASRLIAAGGHYGVASAGDASMRGWAVGVVHAVTPHVQGRVDYTFLSAEWSPSTGADRRALRTFAPQAMRAPSERIHDVSASLDAELPQTATRFVLLYKVNTGFVGAPSGIQPANGRFDMQLRQGLPFMGGMGDWEMLLGVRSLFRPTLDDRSMYDELLVVRAPKRLIGGLQVRF
jgi:Carboxypeptidase regulatory-like domain/TonB dependent receptor